MSDQPARLLLEIKVDTARRPYAGIEEKVLALVRARGLATRVLIMAFQPDTLRRVRALDAATPTVLLANRARIEREGAAALVQEARACALRIWRSTTGRSMPPPSQRPAPLASSLARGRSTPNPTCAG